MAPVALSSAEFRPSIVDDGNINSKNINSKAITIKNLVPGFENSRMLVYARAIWSIYDCVLLGLSERLYIRLRLWNNSVRLQACEAVI